MLTDWISRLFGFLLGTTLAGASVYYYILEEYKVSNELLTEDIYVCGAIYIPFPDIRANKAGLSCRREKGVATTAILILHY